jgi:GR25 family glycosyltransferase involved in LPS biosynthesis
MQPKPIQPVKIDKAVCMCLDRRIQNYNHINEQCQKYLGIEPQLFISGNSNLALNYNRIDIRELPPKLRFSTSYPSWWTFGCYNAYLSHKQILEEFLDTPLETLLILEDDIQFEPDFAELYNTTIPILETVEWSMIYLGCYFTTRSRQISATKNIYRVDGVAGWHAVLLKRHIVEEVLKFGPIGPMDNICGRFIHQKYPCYGIYPSIITQQSGYSYIEGGYLNKKSRYERYSV